MAARNMERAENRAKELNDEGCNVKTVYNDATEKETYTSMVEEVFKNEGRIDILVNNFGTSNPQKDLDIKNTEYDEYIRTVDINLASVFMTSREARNSTHGSKWRWKYYQHFFHRRSASGYFPDCIRNQ